MIPRHPAAFARVRCQASTVRELVIGSRDTAETERLTLFECFQTRTILKSRTDQRQQFVSDHIIIEIVFRNCGRAVVTENHPTQ